MSDLKANKNCFLAFRSKKINDFDGANAIIKEFAGECYYFDKVSFIAFDSSEEIVRALKDGKENYENIVVYCPYEMGDTLKNFIAALYGSSFSEKGVLETDSSHVFVLYSDRDNFLTVGDICEITDEKYAVQYSKIYVRTIGATISDINLALSEAEKLCSRLMFSVSEKYGDCRIVIRYPSETPKNVTDGFVRVVLNVLNDYVYALEDVSIEERLFTLLKLRKMKISVAESFTGGGISKTLVSLPGISEVFFEGLNTYSNKSKMNRLGVKELTLLKRGAVSEETAREMAEGLINSGNCDISISTTGIAGPKSDNTNKPVGLIYIAVGTTENITVKKYNLKGDRDNITNTAIKLALFLAYKMLK